MPSLRPSAAAACFCAPKSSQPTRSLSLASRAGVVARVVDQRPAVLEHQALVIGHLVGLDEVARAYLSPVQAQLRRDRVDGALHHEAAVRPPRAAIRGDQHRIRIQRVELDPVRVRLVRAEQLGRGHDRHDQAVRHVGAVVVPEPHRQAADPAVVLEADGDVMLLGPLVRAGDEVLAPVLGELHRPQQLPGRPRHQHLLRPRVHDLHPEAAADIRGDHVYVGQRQVELGRDGRAHAGGGLGRGPQAQVAGLRIPAGQHAAAFHRGRRGPLDVQVELQHARGGGDDRGGVAVLLHRVRRDVAGHVGMHEVLGFPGRVDTDHGGQFLITDVDQVGGVFGQVAIGGDDHDDGLADVVDLVLRQRVRRPAVG